MPVDEAGKEPGEEGYKGPPGKDKKKGGTKWWAEMVGPLPVGVWVGILALGIGYSIWHRRHGGATTDNTATDPTADQTVGLPNYADGTVPNPWILGGATDPGLFPGSPSSAIPPGAVTPTPAAIQTSSGPVTAAQPSAQLSPSDQQRIAELQSAGIQPIGIATGTGATPPPAPPSGYWLAPLPESSPGVFPYAATPTPSGGVYTGSQAAAFGATTYNPNPGYGHSAYGTF